jgi:hypothetical protein
MICRDLKLFTQAVVAIDGSKFKAVNSRDNNFTPNKIARRQEQIEQSIQRYLDSLETADRTQPAEVETKTERLREKGAFADGNTKRYSTECNADWIVSLMR